MRETHSRSCRRAHSQILITFQPVLLSVRETCRSRLWLLRTFFSQTRAFRFGVKFLLQLCPCQKQPSTKTASFDRGKTKSGLPNSRELRLQPLTRAARSSPRSLISVVTLRLLPLPTCSCDSEMPLKFKMPWSLDCSVRMGSPYREL